MPYAKLRTGIRMSFEECGPPEGEPLLLLAPLARDRSAWARQLPALARTMRCIALDARGTGDSDKPDDGYSLSGFAEDAAALLEHLGHESAHVAGWSAGSAVALELALAWPDRVRSLSLYMPWARTDGYVRQGLQLLGDLARHAPPSSLEATTSWLLFSREYFDASWEALERHNAEVIASPGYPPRHALLGHVAASLAHDVTDRLGAIDVPTLVVGAAEDRMVPAPYARAVHDGIAGARWQLFVGVGASHGVPVERTEEFNDVALDFLNQVMGAQRPSHE